MALFTFGTDAEFFIHKDGKPRSAIGIVPGTKYKRYKRNGHEYFYDNVLAECAVKYGRNKEETINNIQDCLQVFTEIVKPYDLCIEAYKTLPKSELAHKDAIQANCDSEACAYSLKPIKLPKHFYTKNNSRSAGGHLHLGSKIIKKDDFSLLHVVRMLDLFVGLPSIFIDYDPSSIKRKRFYGHAGRYRITSYGAEYRTLGNFWLKSPELVGLIYDLADFTLDFIQEGKHLDFWFIDQDMLNDENFNKANFDPMDAHQCYGYDPNCLTSSINKMDRKKGEKFLLLLRKLMPSNLYKRIINNSSKQKQKHFLECEFYEEWNLND